MATGKKKRSGAIEVDFEGVESGGGGRAVPDGVYSVKVAQAPTKEEGSDSGEAYLSWKFAITKGKFKGAPLYDNTSLQPQALWKLKSLLEAMGEEVPDSTLRLVPGEYVDRELQVEVVNEEYNGRDRPKVTAYIVESGEEDADGSEEDDADEEEEEEEKPKKKKKKDEDEEEESEEEESEEEEEEDEKPKGKGKRALARAAAKKKDDDEDEEEEEESEDADEEEEEEDEKPKGKKTSSKIKKGAQVKFSDEGKTIKGKVMEVDGSVATVDVKGDEWQVQLEDLTLIS